MDGKKTDKALIGSFFTGAVLLVTAAVFVFGSGSFFTEKNVFILYFKGSVQGLNVGSPVVLRGVKIGSVRDIRINADSQKRSFSIPVFIEVRKDCIVMQEEGGRDITMEGDLDYFISQGLRAQLEIQSMVTGQLLIALDFHPERKARFSGIKSEFHEIPTISSDIEELTRKIKQVPIEEIFNKLLSVISGIEATLNSETVEEMVCSLALMLKNTNQLVKNVDNALPGLLEKTDVLIKDIHGLVGHTDEKLVWTGDALKKIISDIGHLLNKTTDQVELIGSGTDMTLKEARKLMTGIRSDVEPIWGSINKTVEATADASRQVEETLRGINGLTAKDSEILYNLNSTLNEISDAARSLRLLAQYLERHPEALIQGKK